MRILIPILLSAASLTAALPPRKTQSRSLATRVKLQPRLVPGEVMRYQIELETESAMKHSGAIQDPEGPSQLVVTWDATVRLEVLGAADASAPASIRVRTTYEKSSAAVSSDTPDPNADGIKKQYDNLQGLSFEFTLAENGQVSAVHGLEGIITDDKARVAAEEWMRQLSGSSSFPAAGIVPGQHWNSEQAADSMPLNGLSWRTDSTYLRNEPCRPATPNGSPATISGDTCAVILTDLSLDTKHVPKDPTPDDYRRNGMRTSGNWIGSGESLTYVSLNSGWVVSATQNGTEQMDVTVLKAGEDSVHYAGTVRTRSSVSLSLPDLSGPVDTPKPADLPKP
jgi:hypothetical protein